MANIWLDPIKNDENRIGGAGVGGAPIKVNNIFWTKSQSVKKQAFGELNNVILNQQQMQAVTPFKSGVPVATEVFPGCYSASKSKSLCNEVLRREHSKQTIVHGKQKLEHLFKAKSINAAAAPAEKTQQSQEEDLFDCLDFSFACSDGSCHKTETEIWSEMNAISDDILNKVLEGGDADSDTESVCEIDDLHDSSLSIDLLCLDVACAEDKKDDDYVHVLPLKLHSSLLEIDDFSPF